LVTNKTATAPKKVTISTEALVRSGAVYIYPTNFRTYLKPRYKAPRIITAPKTLVIDVVASPISGAAIGAAKATPEAIKETKELRTNKLFIRKPLKWDFRD